MKNYFDALTKEYEDIIIEINNEFQNMFYEKIKNRNSKLKLFLLFNRETVNRFSNYKSSYDLKFEITNNENETTFRNLTNKKGFQLNTMTFSYSLTESNLITEIKTIGFLNNITKKDIKTELLFSKESSTITMINSNSEYAYLSFNHISDFVYLYPTPPTIEPEYFNIIKNIGEIDMETAMEIAFEKRTLSTDEKESFYLIHDIKLENIDHNFIFDINNIKKLTIQKQIINKNKRK